MTEEKKGKGSAKKGVVATVPKKVPATVPEKSEVGEMVGVAGAMQLIAMATQQGAGVETIERLMAIRRELQAEWAKGEFDKAMAKFQSECPTIQKTKIVNTNDGKEAYRYAPLDSIVEQVKEALTNNGLSYSTNMEKSENGVKITVLAKHISGHSEPSVMEVPLSAGTKIMSVSQVTASAATFAKRYAFCNAFGIMTGDADNDGARPAGEPVAEPNKSSLPASAQHKDIIRRLCKSLKVAPEKIEEQVGHKVDAMTQGVAENVIQQLTKMLEKKQGKKEETPEVNGVTEDPATGEQDA